MYTAFSFASLKAEFLFSYETNFCVFSTLQCKFTEKHAALIISLQFKKVIIYVDEQEIVSMEFLV